MIKKIRKDYATIIEEENPIGSCLAEYNDNAVEYKYIIRLSELINRLGYIDAQEFASKNKFRNENMALVKFLNGRHGQIIEKPNGIKDIIS